MRLGDYLDAILEPFAPATAARRQAVRMGMRAVRQYDAAQNDRRTKGWRRPATSADAEISRGLASLRASGHELARNNKYAAAAVMHMKAQVVGDGITARAVHDDEKIASVAQDEWDRRSASAVHEGVNDHFHVQKLIAGGLVEGGEMLQVWQPDDAGPNGNILVYEGDYLDQNKTQKIPTGRIVQGVQFENGRRTGYWMFDEHPGDMAFASSLVSKFNSARDVDHVFEQLRAGQTRGVSWFGPVALDLRDLADIESAMALKKKIENCIGIVLTPPENSNVTSPLDANATTDAAGRKEEKISPGMAMRVQPGEQVTVVNPTPTMETVAYIKQQLAAISAIMVPYHVMTGDVTGANYTSLRASLLAFGARLDDIQQQIIIPRVCQSAFNRWMMGLYLKHKDARFLQVTAQWAVPGRPLLNPVQELMAEILGIRAGLESITKNLARRGIDVNKHFAELARINKLIDDLGLALDTDPRRLTGAGILQAAAGYLAPKGDTSN